MVRSVIFVLLAAILFSGSLVCARELPSEWSDCNISADCAVVSSPCGASHGINIRHKTEAHTEICKKEDCSGGCNGSAIQAYAATCKNGKCVPDYRAKPPEQPQMHYELKNLELRCPPDEPGCGVTH